MHKAIKKINSLTKKWIIYTIIIVFFIFSLIFTFSLLTIYTHVKDICTTTKEQYNKDCVSSLILYTQSDKTTTRQKNTAVWALGQLADKRALPYLKELNESTTQQNKCNYDEYICKHEIQKAIKWCQKGNITSWMYKGL